MKLWPHWSLAVERSPRSTTNSRQIEQDANALPLRSSARSSFSRFISSAAPKQRINLLALRLPILRRISEPSADFHFPAKPNPGVRTDRKGRERLQDDEGL
ncbi:hypothetical protein HPP92_028363 [Vanilla planifolia]|uniref:Uncharacterized protein n=1 Tax=Vanilla planifolia TaxID=51239 RepID=A0A835PB97_VANPL|nr:hypothetical protein HPP92_028363 [Vanilla planifolia]